MPDPMAIIGIIEGALRLLQWAAPAIGRAFQALLLLIRQIQAQARAGEAAGAAVTLGDAAGAFADALNLAREGLDSVKDLNFGTDNPKAEAMLRIRTLGESVETAMGALGKPINTTVGITAAQMAFAEKRAEDPTYGRPPMAEGG